MKIAFSRWILLLSLVSWSKASLLQDILTALKNAVDCGSCHALLLPIKLLADLGDTEFSDTFTTICQLLKIEDNDVCVGLFNLTGPVLAHSIRQFSFDGDTATKFCSATFGLCLQPSVAPFKVPIPKQAPTNPKQFVSTGKPPFQVIHFSDVHVDKHYTVGADANCTKPICCRNFADHTGPVEIPAGPFGNSKCDSPSVLGQSMLDAINQIGSTARFSILTGDVVDHAVWLVDRPEATSELTAWNSQMAANVIAPVYPSLGNHDTAPVNSFPRQNTKTPLNTTWVFDIQSQGWERWINASGSHELLHNFGSYAINVPETNLRIISLNTQYWYPLNFFIYDTNHMPPDPNGVLAFLASQLQASEDAGQRAWIIGHIPPGGVDFFHDQSNYYDQLVQRYKNTIAAQFFGHTHRDQFQIAYSDYSNQNENTADSIAFICPSLTPTSGHPSFKLYDVDPDTLEVMDSKVFIANMSDPEFQTKPTWELEYSARDSYGAMVGGLGPTDSLNATFWHKLTEVFEANDAAFQTYNARLSRGAQVTPCTGDCKNLTICGLRALRSQNNCVIPSPGVSFGRRDLPDSQRQPHLDCEGGGVSSLLRDMMLHAQSAEFALNPTINALLNA